MTRRPEDTTTATAEERVAAQSTPVSDDGTGLKPTVGSSVPDGFGKETNSTPLRKPITIGTWNVRGMSDGKLQIVEREMIANDVKILGVSELWWLGQGRFTSDDGNMVVYSGRDSGRRRKGVAFIVEKTTAKSVIGYNPINERVMTLRLQGNPVNISVMQVYAPTSEAPESEIVEFYEMVQGVLDNIPKQDLLVVLGDWNAIIGKSFEASDVVGKHGLGTRNERGDRLYEFCMANKLVVGNTLFQHHPRRLWTWSSPGDRTRNQIDFIIVQKRWRSTLQNVRTRPSAECGSDHQLLVAKLKVRLKAKRGNVLPTRYDVDNIPVQYTVEVKNKFEQLMKVNEEEETPSELWEDMREAVKDTAKKYIPKKKKRKQPWISQQTLDLADKRKEAKVAGDQDERRRLSKEVSKSVKEDKRIFIEGKCQMMESCKGDSKIAFGIAKELTKKWAPRIDVVNDANGTTLTESEAIKKRWVEYSTKLFEAQDQQVYFQDESIEQEPLPLRAEVEQAMGDIKKSKSPGIDEIPAELLQATGEEGIDIMWRLCCLIWKTGEWPKDWCRAVFVPLPKKGNLKECSNHRTISLICHASKVLLKIIIRRLKLKLEQEICDEQAGFREGRGTRDQIVNIRNVIEKCKGHKIPLYMCFIDYSKAFDCVSHSQMWKTMIKMGFPGHIVNLISQLYEDQESAVRTSNGDTEWFKIGRGLRQGCILSPSLFNIYSEDIMRDALDGFIGGIKFGGKCITNLRYADDTTLICGSREELLELLKRIKEASEERGLLLNAKKTKIMVLDRNSTGEEFFIDGQQIEEVKQFDYLGSMINNNGDSTTEIKRRLAMARTTTQSMSKIWKSRGLSTDLKVRLLRATVFSIATYGCESWAMTKNNRKRIDAFEVWCYRRLLRVSWTDKRTNNWVLGKIGTDLTIRKSILERKLSYFGHIVRRNGGIEKQILQGAVEGRRGRGRPATSWTDDVKTVCSHGVYGATKLASDRRRWSALVKATAAQLSAI